MAIPSGLDAQLGTAEESTYGTPVTVDRHYEFRSESLALSIERIESQGLRPGRRILPSARWAAGQRSVGGDVTMELVNKGMGRWWKHALGGVATSQPDDENSPTVYLHTFTPGTIPTGLTVQVGRPDVTGTVRAFTYHGCKVASWGLECAVGEIATFTATLLGEDEDTGTALATATYPADLALMTFVEGTLTLGGSAQDVKSFSLTGANGLSEDRYFLGSRLRKQPLEAALREITATAETEFESLTNYTRFVAGTEAELVLTFAAGVIEDALPFQTVITANVRFDGETPGVSGAGHVMQNVPCKVIDDGTLSIKVEYQTTDATP
ncbi:phage tail tube protein [Actinophytocola sediminis]